MYDDARTEWMIEQRKQDPDFPKTTARWGLSLFIALLGGVLFQILNSSLGWLWNAVGKGAVSYAAQAVFTLGLLTTGGLLFLFKLRWITYYGWTELGFGVAMGLNAAFSTQMSGELPSSHVILGVVGSAYLVVRGLENITKKRRDQRDQARLKLELQASLGQLYGWQASRRSV